MARDRVPTFILAWRVEWEEKQRQQNLCVRVSPLDQFALASIAPSFKVMLGCEIRNVISVLPGMYQITVENSAALEKAMLMNGKTLTGSRTTLKVTQVDKTPKLEEMFDFIH